MCLLDKTIKAGAIWLEPAKKISPLWNTYHLILCVEADREALCLQGALSGVLFNPSNLKRIMPGWQIQKTEHSSLTI